MNANMYNISAIFGAKLPAYYYSDRPFFRLSCLAMTLLTNICTTYAQGDSGSKSFADVMSVTGWTLLGPFPSSQLEEVAEDGVTRTGFHQDFLQSFGGEAQAVFKPGDLVAFDGAELSAFSRKAWGWGWNDIPEFNRHVGYASKVMEMNEEVEMFLYFMSHGSPKVWLNGEQILSGFEERHLASKMQYGAKIRLQKGDNRFLVKLDNLRNWAGFQLELIRQDAHEKIARERLKELKITRLNAGVDGSVNVLVRHDPPALDFRIPIKVRVLDSAGQELVSQEGFTTEVLEVAIPEGVRETVRFETVTQENASVALKPAIRSYYSADFAAWCQKLGARFAKVREVIAGQTPSMIPALKWLDQWLASASEHDPSDATDLKNLQYVEDLVVAAEGGKNLFIEESQSSFPCVFEGVMADGVPVNGEYHITVPATYWDFSVEERQASLSPLLYKLHGSGGTGLAVYPYRDDRSQKGFDEVDHQADYFLTVLPRANFEYRWLSAWLDVLHEHLLDVWKIDESQMHLQGFSMGGIGTFWWGLEHPDRFATLAPMGISGESWVFNDKSREEVLSLLKEQKMWYVIGQQDDFFEEAIVLYQLLKQAGVDIRFSVYGSRGHGGLEELIEAEGLRAWQKRNKKASFGGDQ